MELQTKACQNCKNQFTIEPDDFAFYAKINVPPPTWCPDCRQQRRIMFRNFTNCIGCVGLKQKSYHLFNEYVGREGYEKFKNR